MVTVLLDRDVVRDVEAVGFCAVIVLSRLVLDVDHVELAGA